MKGFSTKRTVMKVDSYNHDRKIDSVEACAGTFQPGNLTGWGSERVNPLSLPVKLDLSLIHI